MLCRVLFWILTTYIQKNKKASIIFISGFFKTHINLKDITTTTLDSSPKGSE